MIFSDAKENINVNLKFALPGKERQDSVYNGLQVIEQSFYSMLHLLSHDMLDFSLLLSYAQ